MCRNGETMQHCRNSLYLEIPVKCLQLYTSSYNRVKPACNGTAWSGTFFEAVDSVEYGYFRVNWKPVYRSAPHVLVFFGSRQWFRILQTVSVQTQVRIFEPTGISRNLHVAKCDQQESWGGGETNFWPRYKPLRIKVKERHFGFSFQRTYFVTLHVPENTDWIYLIRTLQLVSHKLAKYKTLEQNCLQPAL